MYCISMYQPSRIFFFSKEITKQILGLSLKINKFRFKIERTNKIFTRRILNYGLYRLDVVPVIQYAFVVLHKSKDMS
jgi:hypothetical protein